MCCKQAEEAQVSGKKHEIRTLSVGNTFRWIAGIEESDVVSGREGLDEVQLLGTIRQQAELGMVGMVLRESAKMPRDRNILPSLSCPFLLEELLPRSIVRPILHGQDAGTTHKQRFKSCNTSQRTVLRTSRKRSADSVPDLAYGGSRKPRASHSLPKRKEGQRFAVGRCKRSSEPLQLAN